jgi:hypothetical protein
MVENGHKDETQAFVDKMKTPVFVKTTGLKDLRKVSQLKPEHPVKQYLSTRWAGHTSDYRRKPINCASKELFDEYGHDNCQIVSIEEYLCNSKDAKMHARDIL